jgi:hypothetical protein
VVGKRQESAGEMNECYEEFRERLLRVVIPMGLYDFQVVCDRTTLEDMCARWGFLLKRWNEIQDVVDAHRR